MITQSSSIDHAGMPPEASRFTPLGQTAPPAEGHASDASASFMSEMSSGGGDMPIDLSGTKKKLRLSSQLLLMMGVLVLSAGALYIMRRAGTGAGMKFISVPVEFALDQIPMDRLADHQRMLRLLDASDQPIEPEEVEKNPFHLVVPGDATSIADLDPEAAARLAEQLRAAEADKRKTEIQRALSSIRIHSILNGKRPVANIGDSLVSIGDTVAEHFTVVDIQDRAVVLEAAGQRYTLTIDDQPKPTPRRRPRRN
jgi:hypothetical protein